MNEKEKRGSQLFRFKQFSVGHESSSMKVGIDGVLIGAWGTVNGNLGLDIGCGCGLLALMTAQRNHKCFIDMIDIHPASVEEARRNIEMSKWENRLSVMLADADDYSQVKDNQEKYDFIISNPPFYHSGMKSPVSPRERARHEGTLSPYSLLGIAQRLLKPGGTLSMIGTAQTLIPQNEEMHIERICRVCGKAGKSPKRIMISLRKVSDSEKNFIPTEETLFIREEDGSYSNAYKELTKEFYLNF